mgnify:CR=1 FL=1|nr:MAG: hypothetical protein [Bacteriophage sp.]UWG90093.1 MAG: hypothetical protein [Bacteriophage sp.]
MGKKKRSSKKKKGIGVMNIILIIVGVSLFSFTIAMIQVFREYGAIPDTLVTCVFAALAGECGIMGWIKTTKERKQDRAWQQQDKREAEREMREAEKRAQEQQQQNVNTLGG